MYANWNRWSGMPVKKRTGLLESGLGSGGLAGLWMDQPGGRINVGGNWVVVSMGSGATQYKRNQSRGGHAGVGRNEWQGLGGGKNDGRCGQRRSRSTSDAPIAFRHRPSYVGPSSVVRWRVTRFCACAVCAALCCRAPARVVAIGGCRRSSYRKCVL